MDIMLIHLGDAHVPEPPDRRWLGQPTVRQAGGKGFELFQLLRCKRSVGLERWALPMPMDLTIRLATVLTLSRRDGRIFWARVILQVFRRPECSIKGTAQNSL